MTGVHVGVIPDGGRRWTQRTGADLGDAYRRTLHIVATLIEELHALDAADVTLYVTSAENLGRPRAELDALVRALDALPATLGRLHDAGVIGTVALFGRLESSPEIVRGLAPLVRERSTGLRLNVLVAYDAWEELRNVQVPPGELLSLKHLPIPRRLDSVIRSGGGALLSGLLPLQATYAQLVVTDALFNDLTGDELRDLARRACGVEHQFGL